MKKRRTILTLLTGAMIVAAQAVTMLTPANAVIGLPNDKDPGEPTVAVGQSDIVEVMNSDISIWAKTNLSTPILSESFQAFLGTPAGANNCGDPIIQYLPLNQRWALTCTQGSGVSLAVSETSDPAGAWYRWIDQAQTGIPFLDGPKLLTTNDKLAIYGGPSSSDTDALYVYPLASVLAGTLPAPVLATLPNGPARHFGHLPAVYQNRASVSADGYFVGNGCTDLGCGIDILHLFGPPRSPTVTATFAGADTAPPLPSSNAPIPGGSAEGSSFFGTGVLAAAAETRTTDNHPIIAFSGQQGCPTDPTRYCTYRDIYDLSNPQLTQTWSGLPGSQDELFGSIGLDAAGNLFDSHIYMNAATDPSAGAAGPNWHASIAAATATTGSLNERFGDYYDAAQDPADGSKVWFAAAYQTGGGESQYGTAFGCGTAAGYGCGGVTPAGSGPRAQYENLDSKVTDNSIKPGLQLVNNTTAPVSLSGVTIRYWFKRNGGAPTYAATCDYALISCANLTETVVNLPTPRTGADAYLQVGFQAGAGSLPVGGSTGQMQLRFNKTDWSSFNQANDYSYAANQAFADSIKVTVYVNGQLTWGAEP